MPERCDNCKFWLRKDGVDGACRRSPPAVHQGAQVGVSPNKVVVACMSVWPSVVESDWCGEWKKIG